MDTLAADLREATSDLLELPGAPRQYANGIKSTKNGKNSPKWSTKSRLVVISSDEEDEVSKRHPRRGVAKVTVSPPAIDLQAEQVSGDEHDGTETLESSVATLKAADRFGSLSSRTPSLQPTSAVRPSQQERSLDQATWASSPPSLSPRSAQSNTKLEVFEKLTAKRQLGPQGTTSNVWLNERGERVVDGKVVGQLSLTRRGQGDDDGSSGADEAESSTMGLVTPVKMVAARDSRPFDHTEHGASQRLHTPDFFMRSFPGRTSATETSPRPSADIQYDATHASLQEADGSPKIRPQISRKTSPMASLSSSVIASPELAAVSSEPVTLHGNRRAAQLAGKVEPDINKTSAQLRGSGGIAWQTDQHRSHRRSASGSRPRASPRTSSFKERPLLDRASSLFSTPLVPPRAERETMDDEAGEWEDEGRPTDDRDALLSSPTSSIAPALPSPTSGDGDTSSLMSLPASSVTASNSDGASMSRRSISLHRANSTGSNSSLRRRSIASNEVYARDVRIRGWSEVGTKTRGGYVSFEIVVLTKRGVIIRAHRRYSSFAMLRKQLAMEVPQHKNALPRLPPKDALHKYSAKHLEQRRLDLTEWLQAVMLDVRWGGRTREWLVGTGT